MWNSEINRAEQSKAKVDSYTSVFSEGALSQGSIAGFINLYWTMTPVIVPIILLIAAINCEIEYGIEAEHCINDYAFQMIFFYSGYMQES